MQQVVAKIEPVAGRCVWRGVDLASKDDWVIAVDTATVADLAEAVADARARGGGAGTLDIDRYAFGRVGRLADTVRDALAVGYGFCLLRGIEAERFSVEELKMMLLILGNHIGLIGPQENGPRSIGEVMDTGPDKPKTFYYHRGGALPMHVDPVDVVGLMCVRAAKHGGASGIASAMAVHNELLKTRPDALRVLYRGFHRLKRHKAEDRGLGRLTDAPVPVYADIGGGEMVCTFITESVLAGVRAGLMTLSEAEREAISLVERTAERPDLMLSMDLRPGDLQVLNNRVILHNRLDYEDHSEAARRRLMLRLWLSMPGWRKFPANIPYLDVETGRFPE